MSEECTHDCSTCGSSCEHVDAKDLIAPLNKDSSIKHGAQHSGPWWFPPAWCT